MSNRLNEKIFVEINGLKQCMFIKSEDTRNPVLLFLHGGPGSPEISFDAKYPTKTEKLFTVCWWEQRGAGASYQKSTKKDSMTVEQMIDDTVAVANYLKKRFNKEKVYLMGHSWGSVLGTLTASRYPELFHAYIGTGQVADQDRSERLAYTYMLEEFQKASNKKMIKKLEGFLIDEGAEISNKYLAVRSEGMTKLGIGIMHKVVSMAETAGIILKFKGYSLSEKLRYLMGMQFSISSSLWDTVMDLKLIKTVPSLDIPIYIFQGKFDYQVSYVIAKEYFDAVKAPVKGFYSFENSAHSPGFEEPEKALAILREDVLKGKTDLADKQEKAEAAV